MTDEKERPPSPERHEVQAWTETVEDEVLRERVRAAIRREQQPHRGSFDAVARHPLSLVAVGFVLTTLLGASFNEYLRWRRDQATEEAVRVGEAARAAQFVADTAVARLRGVLTAVEGVLYYMYQPGATPGSYRIYTTRPEALADSLQQRLDDILWSGLSRTFDDYPQMSALLCTHVGDSLADVHSRMWEFRVNHDLFDAAQANVFAAREGRAPVAESGALDSLRAETRMEVLRFQLELDASISRLAAGASIECGELATLGGTGPD